jgi:ribokinase
MSIAVVGSANVDLVYRVKRIPSPGETVLAASKHIAPGGKGANQAVAAARAGADVAFVTAVGRDADGDRVTAAVRDAGVRILDRRADAPTGTALITVEASGENSIVVDPGANARLTELTGVEREALAAAGVVLLQLEIPLPTVTQAAALARSSGAVVVLNAAPAAQLPSELLAAVAVLVVNEHEALSLAPSAAGAHAAAAFLARDGRAVVLTLGEAGCLVVAPDGSSVSVAAHRVDAVDTTGAGDAFCGAFAAALDRAHAAGPGERAALTLDELADAARFASAAAALSVQRAGAVPSIPTLAEIRALLAG